MTHIYFIGCYSRTCPMFVLYQAVVNESLSSWSLGGTPGDCSCPRRRLESGNGSTDGPSSPSGGT
uniref:Uncharacterized protein n=1 Tax=Cryptococcus bacillisporus CA1280 TaxID=1296109 RepID=A0A0D0VNJ1_CRYGA|nr:hypothetical protein I312_02458 [Cryptococcus bacillisporus CA1280]